MSIMLLECSKLFHALFQGIAKRVPIEAKTIESIPLFRIELLLFGANCKHPVSKGGLEAGQFQKTSKPAVVLETKNKSEEGQFAKLVGRKKRKVIANLLAPLRKFRAFPPNPWHTTVMKTVLEGL